MGIFTSREIEVSGKRAIQLSHQINEFDRTPRLITLIIQQELSGYTRFPAAFEYLEKPDTQRFWKISSTIRIVVAPGVSVLLQNFPDVYMEGEIPLLEIYRVQDPAVVPPMGTSIASYGLIGTNEINSPPYTIPPDLVTAGTAKEPENYFRIERRPGEVVISHPFSSTILTMDVKQFSRTPGSTADAKDRFCYQFDPQGVLGDVAKPLLKIVKTPAVGLKFSGKSWLKLHPVVNVDLRQELAFWKVYEVDDINAVPTQGYDIVPESGWREITTFDRDPTPEEELALAAFDTLIGFIPVVGQIIDLSEFIYGLVTSKDRWGRKLDVGDKVVMGVGALLILLPHAVSGAERLVKLFGRRAASTEALIEALRRASLTAEEADLIRAMEDAIRKGGRPTAEMLERFSTIMHRIQGEYPDLELFLNADRTGFIHPQLQEQYQNYLQKLKDPGKRANPREWAIRQTTGAPRQLLERLLGPDYARGTRRVASERFFNLKDIPRPLGYTDAKLDEHLKTALRKRSKLVERLNQFLEQRRSTNFITRFLARERVGSGHFRILKGNLGEIFSSAIQLQVLREYLIAEPGARLISGVRMRLMTEEGNLARSVLFTDNIIALQRGGDLHILGVFEVKAGYEGGQEATSQIFKWIEGHITDGSQLVIPQGAQIINADGIESVVKRELTFTYKPDQRGVAEVINLQTADRHIIAARGSSHLGIDSAEQVAAKVTRHTLEMSSAELDYLVARILSGLELE